MTTYSLGQQVTLSTSAVDDDGDPIDATLVLMVTKPDGTSITPGVSHVGSTGSGDYEATFTVDQVKAWTWRWAATGSIAASDFGQFDVENPPPPAYASVPDLRENLNLTATDRDVRLAQVLMSASRAIDKATGRRFWLDPTPSARVFSARDRVVSTPDGEKLLIDDIGSTNSLAVALGSAGSFTAVVSDYTTGPDNALVRGEPITWLQRFYIPWSVIATQQIQVTAQWGFPSIPDEITEATLLLANRRYKRRSSPEGVLGSAEWGVIRVSRSDPDVMDMISPYMLPGIG